MKYINICLLLVMFSFAAYPQEKKDSTGTIPLNFNMQYSTPELPDFELQRTLYFSEEKTPFITDTNAIWLSTSYALSNQGTHYLPGAPEPHMLANFHDMYVDNSKFSIVKTVLGMAQLGAVGYLAYKSIKKYGFWDNK